MCRRRVTMTDEQQPCSVVGKSSRALCGRTTATLMNGTRTHGHMDTGVRTVAQEPPGTSLVLIVLA